MTDRDPAIRVLLLPKDTNAYGTIFGGVILSHIDLASAIEARRAGPHRFGEKAHDIAHEDRLVELDLAHRLRDEAVRAGRTSVTVRVLVEAERWGAPFDAAAARNRGERIKVTEAEVVFVAVNAEGRPVPVRPEA